MELPVSESMASCCDCVCAMIAVSAPALTVLGKSCFCFVFNKENRLCDHGGPKLYGDKVNVGP